MTKPIIGTVIKKSGEKTISVLINRKVKHPIYGKQMTKSKKLLVHDIDNKGIVGQEIAIIPTKPISKSKHYTVFSAKSKE
jgi:small subunit ribosomal protein S17